MDELSKMSVDELRDLAYGEHPDVHWESVTTALLQRVATAEAEIARRNDFHGCDGCSTGDCPHGSVQECADAMSKIIQEQSATIASLEARAEAAEGEVRRQADEILALEGVVAKLRHTEDGVPITSPYASVWIITRHAKPKVLRTIPYQAGLRPMYSTQEAAEAALTARQQPESGGGGA